MSAASRLKRGLGEAATWFRNGRIGWWALVIGLVSLTLMCRFLPFELEHRLAVIGTVFQLVGIAVTGIGIGRLRRHFNLDPVIKSFLKYFYDIRYIFISRPPISISANLFQDSDVILGTTVIPAPPTGTDDQRLTRLEQKVKDLYAAVGAANNKINEVARDLRAEIKQEASVREAGDVKGEGKLKQTVVGDWQLQLIGLAYFCVGIILGTIPGLIIKAFHYLGLA
jgi:hypothetical protein